MRYRSAATATDAHRSQDRLFWYAIASLRIAGTSTCISSGASRESPSSSWNSASCSTAGRVAISSPCAT